MFWKKYMVCNVTVRRTGMKEVNCVQATAASAVTQSDLPGHLKRVLTRLQFVLEMTEALLLTNAERISRKCISSFIFSY